MSQKSVEGFHSDLSIDDRSTLDPTYTSESSVTSSTMSDEMDEWNEWNISDLELASEDVGSEEVEVAISGRNVGRGRARGRSQGGSGRGTTLVVGETSTAGQG